MLDPVQHYRRQTARRNYDSRYLDQVRMGLGTQEVPDTAQGMIAAASAFRRDAARMPASFLRSDMILSARTKLRRARQLRLGDA